MKKHEQYLIHRKSIKDTETTNEWFRSNGINPDHYRIGVAEIFQAQKMAFNALKLPNGVLLANQGHTLQNFLKKASNAKTRQTITLGQCFTVMNIAKEAQRRHTKLQRKLHK